MPTRRFSRVLVAFLGFVLPSLWPPAASLAQAQNACGLANAAFCDPLGATFTGAERSGELNPVVWGASRINQENPGQAVFDGWGESHMQQCHAAPAIRRDLEVCHGALLDSVNDNGADASLSWYPRQPFDFAGRTGKIVFDVTDDSQGLHFAWPEFSITTTPAPAPHANIVADPLQNLPQYGFGFDLGDLNCGSTCFGNVPPGYDGTQDCVTSRTGWVTNNYAITVLYANETGCVLEPPGASTGQGTLTKFNNFEIDISQTKVRLYGTDAGTTGQTPRLIAEYNNLNLPFTRGLIWLQDDHYNACKPTPGQCDHTFAWRNVGFDGPVLAQDRGYEYSDSLTGSDGTFLNLGYNLHAGAPGRTFTFSNVQNVEHATGALLVYNFDPEWNAPTVTYSVNGHAAQTYAFPIPSAACFPSGTSDDCEGTFQQGVIQLPLGQLVDGTDSITLQSSSDITLENVDLILQGAGATFQPFWVQNFVVTPLWSGPDGGAVSFGLQPQFSGFLVVQPQAGSRLYVYNPRTHNYAYIDAAAVGPSGPPSA